MQNRSTNADKERKLPTDRKADVSVEAERQIEYDMLYLAAYGINRKAAEKKTDGKTAETGNDCRPGERTDESCLQRYRTDEEQLKALCYMSAKHFIDTLVGMALKQAGVRLPKFWEERIGKAMRKEILFDAERKKLYAWMDREEIWYLPLKGIVLKDYYPASGMRQMSDNDILFDADAWEKVEKHMLLEGYQAESVGKGNHDVYQKPPVYNFELHRSLYGKGHEESWVEYYSDVKERLLPDRDRADAKDGTTIGKEAAVDKGYGYHMRDEDFYVYITSHAYKHYSNGGTGIRTLLDFYACLSVKEETLDFSYIEKECKKLGIDAFEKQNRRLCKKVFSLPQRYDRASFEQFLSPEEREMLQCYLSSGVYGTLDRLVVNRMKKRGKATGRAAKISYYWSRIFPGMELYGNYPLLVKHKWLIPAYWFLRILRLLFSRKRREKITREVRAVQRAVMQKDQD